MNIASYEKTSFQEVDKTGTLVKYMNDRDDGEKFEFEMTIRRRETLQAVHRHRHKLEQIRYTMPGPDSAWSSTEGTPTGSLLYIGSGIFYGPYDRAAGEEYFTVKFGGSEDRPEDKKRPFPKPRFSAPAEFNPENFSWVAIADGVKIKHLATFTERLSSFRMIKIISDKSVEIGSSSVTLGFVTGGSGKASTYQLAQWDCLTLHPDERIPVVGSSDGLELLVIELPVPADASGEEAHVMLAPEHLLTFR